jgi:hypothetical protein
VFRFFIQGVLISLSSSSTFLFVVPAQPVYRTSAFEAFFPLKLFLVPRSSPEALQTRLREKLLLKKERIMGDKWPVKFN